MNPLDMQHFGVGFLIPIGRATRESRLSGSPDSPRAGCDVLLALFFTERYPLCLPKTKDLCMSMKTRRGRPAPGAAIR